VFQKIERLKSELHLLDFQGKQQKKHVFFFDTKKEGMKCLGRSATSLSVVCCGDNLCLKDCLAFQLNGLMLQLTCRRPQN
jgi:hypothetical protein